MNVRSGTAGRVPTKKRAVREYTLGEEIANAITHGIGAGLSVAALVSWTAAGCCCCLRSSSG